MSSTRQTNYWAVDVSNFAIFLVWVFVAASSSSCLAWTSFSFGNHRPSHREQSTSSTASLKSLWTMDSEGPMIPYTVPSFFRKPQMLSSPSPINQRRSLLVDKPQGRRPGHGLFGLPWTSSIASNATLGCVYMPFWEWQLSVMEQSLTNFQLEATTTNTTSKYVESLSGQHRMVTLTASSDEYRSIRMTYLDGGDHMQIFTSVWYPRGNLPLFGLDALQFQNGKRQLAICDFQPIHDNEENHDAMFEQLLAPIRQSFPHLQEEMSDRFFDPTRYFSKQTLLGRFHVTANNKDVNGKEDPQALIWTQLWPAYKAYLQTHIHMVQKTQQRQQSVASSPSTLSPEQILEHHKAYDSYVCRCDPAVPMFSSMFGKDIAEDYLYNIMFPLAEKPYESS